MINEFSFLYGNNEKVTNAFGEYNGEALLNNAKRIFAGNEQVFFEYGRDETRSRYGEVKTQIPVMQNDKNYIAASIEERAPSRITLIGMYGTDIDTGTARYSVGYRNQYCRPLINPKKSMDSLATYETKKYFTIDLSYILKISRAFTNYDFSVFSGEGLRILKAWIYVMTYGVHHPEEPNLIMIQASKNEYGNKVRNRVIVRNSYYDGERRYMYYGSPYAESTDDEWALSADDYSKVAALDTIMTELSLGTPLIREAGDALDLISGGREYGALVPEYFKSILGMREFSRKNNI